MHEFPLTRNLLDLALRNANSKRILRVNLLIGPFPEGRKESIHFYWRDLANGSPGDGPELHFDHVPVEMKCLDCSGIFYLDEADEGCLCRYCHSKHLQLLAGTDVRLESIEVE